GSPSAFRRSSASIPPERSKPIRSMPLRASGIPTWPGPTPTSHTPRAPPPTQWAPDLAGADPDLQPAAGRETAAQQLDDLLRAGGVGGTRRVVVRGRSVERDRAPGAHDTGTRLAASKNGSAATVAGLGPVEERSSRSVPSAMCDA